MKAICRTVTLTCAFLAMGWVFAGISNAESLFGGRRIFLSNDDNHVFKIGVTGTTAGYNFIALAKNARRESVSLGDLGYWELVSDPPSSLRNFDLQLNIENRYDGIFQIEFAYDKTARDIRYRVLEGPVRVKVDTSRYYPTILVEKTADAPPPVQPPPEKTALRRILFFDFNHFDADLRKHYGKVKRMLNHPDYAAYFYYYESTNYDSYHFRTYRNTARLDTEKMGLSLEDGTLVYYQKVLENLKSRHGDDFTDHVILVTRFGKKYANDLKKFARDIGISDDMVVTIWSYDDVQ